MRKKKPRSLPFDAGGRKGGHHGGNDPKPSHASQKMPQPSFGGAPGGNPNPTFPQDTAGVHGKRAKHRKGGDATAPAKVAGGSPAVDRKRGKKK